MLTFEEDEPIIRNALMKRLDAEPGVRVLEIKAKRHPKHIAVGVEWMVADLVHGCSHFDLPPQFEIGHVLNECDEIAEQCKEAKRRFALRLAGLADVGSISERYQQPRARAAEETGNMANVLTNEKPIENVEPPTAPAIRAAILAHIPEDENIQRDIRIHDGIADISIKWRTLRWAICMGMADMSPDLIGLKAAEMFRAWLVSTINNVNETPRHARVLQQMETWLMAQNEGVWSDVTRLRNHKGEFKWLIEHHETPSNVTEYEASA